MEKISINQLPKPGNRKPGVHDMVIGWVPISLVTPIEQIALINNGFYHNQIGGQNGYFTDASLGTIPYYRAQELIQNAFDKIRQNPTQRYLAVFSHKD